MKREHIRDLLTSVQTGVLDIDAALALINPTGVDELDVAVVDTGRLARTGHPEVVFGQGKEAEDVVSILKRLNAARQPGVVTRLTEDKAEIVLSSLPDAVYHRRARVLILPADTPIPTPDVRGDIVIVCAGTSDLPVAEEAAIIAETFGHPITRIWDVGVAGIHRVMNHQATLQSASAIVVIAGMEGALASCPVVAVPTSVGYGASFNGLAALLGMLNSCATGVSVVNIDNGFGAAMMAMRINERRA